MGPASRKQCGVARAQYVRLSPRDLHMNLTPLHEVNSAQVVTLHPGRRWVPRDFCDVVSGEVNRAEHRRENIASGRGIRTGCK
jgi:hypothetical protein